MKTAACLLAISAFVALPAWAQSTSSQAPQFAPAPPPPGMNDPGVKETAPPALPASSGTSGSTPAEVTATPVPGKPIPLPVMPGDKGPPKSASGNSPADDVTVHTEGDAVYQEYRRGGRVYMVVVTQKNGLSYTYTVDDNGTMSATDGAPPVRPVMYKILEWGNNKPAEASSASDDNSQ